MIARLITSLLLILPFIVSAQKSLDDEFESLKTANIDKIRYYYQRSNIDHIELNYNHYEGSMDSLKEIINKSDIKSIEIVSKVNRINGKREKTVKLNSSTILKGNHVQFPSFSNASLSTINTKGHVLDEHLSLLFSERIITIPNVDQLFNKDEVLVAFMTNYKTYYIGYFFK